MKFGVVLALSVEKFIPLAGLAAGSFAAASYCGTTASIAECRKEAPSERSVGCISANWGMAACTAIGIASLSAIGVYALKGMGQNLLQRAGLMMHRDGSLEMLGNQQQTQQRQLIKA